MEKKRFLMIQPTVLRRRFLTYSPARSTATACLLIAVLLGGCASTPVDRTPTRIPGRSPAPSSDAAAAGLYGITDGRLLGLSRGSKLKGEGNAAEKLEDVSSMAYSAKSRRFFAIADASSQPRLVAFDPASGESISIGPIEVPDLDLTLAEALAFNPKDGQLYAAGGDSAFASDVLLVVDPATGQARQIAGIRGTIQNEIDAMTFVGDVLYAIDGAGQSAALYRIDSETGEALRVSEPFTAAVTDLAFDIARNRLIAAQGSQGPLLAISLDGQKIDDLPNKTSEVTAVALVPIKPSLFEDGFESGDTSAWTTPKKDNKQ